MENSFYKHLYQQAGIPILVLDQDGLIASANPAAGNLLGYSPSDLRKLSWGDITKSVSFQDLTAFDDRSLSGNLRSPLEFRCYDQKPILAAINIVRFSIGNTKQYLIHIWHIANEITINNQLLTSSQLLESTFSSLNEAVFILEPGTRKILKCNQAVSDILGYTPQELVGKTTRILHVDDNSFQRFDDVTLPVLDRNSSTTITYQMRRRDGKIIDTDHSITEVKNRQGKRIGVVSVIRDLTSNYQAEEQFRMLFETAPDAYFISDFDGNFVNLNRAAETILGYEKQELIGRNYLDLGLFTADQNQKASHLLHQSQQGLTVGPTEFQLIRKDQTKVNTEVITKPIEYQGLDFVMGIVREITQRKKAELALQKSEQRFRRFFQTSQYGVFITSPEGIILEINQAAVDLFGYPDKTALKSSSITDLYAQPEDRDYFRNQVEREGFIREYLVELKRKNGEIFTGLVSASAVWEEGELLGFQGTIQDISERLAYVDKIEHHSRQMAALREIGLNLSSELDLDDLLKNIVSHAQDLVEGQAAGINLVEPKGKFLDLKVQQGHRSLPDKTRVAKGQGLIGKVWEEKKTILVKNYLHWIDHHPDWVEHFGERAVIGIPVIWNDEILGVLELIRETENPFTEAEKQLLNLFATQAATAIHNARIFEYAKTRLERLRILQEIDQAISGSLNLKMTLNVILDRLTQSLGVDAGTILIHRPHLQDLEFVSGTGFLTKELAGITVPIGSGQAGKAALNRIRIHIPDLRLETVQLARSRLVREEGFITYYGIPLIAKGELMGVMEIFHRSQLSPPPEWFEFLETLAGQTALAIDRLQLFDDLQQSNLRLNSAYNNVIEGWARALELRDHETEGHSRRVVKLTLDLARELEVAQEDLSAIRQGALLHDIGNLGVPDRILQKQGDLNQDEWKIMQEHPLHAYRLLSPIEHLKDALEIPYCHHEKWDGTGYPRGLEGDEIPISARIFAVVDVWDALRSDRPYRKAWPDRKAISYIKEQSGRHFDPQVVKAFLNLINS